MILALAPVVPAHHSFAMFDRDHPRELAGTVREFQWTNPHVWIQVRVPNAAGVQEEWGVELTSVNALRRQGWSRDALHAGDRVRLLIFPLKDGSLGGQLNRVVEINGSASALPGYR